MMRPKEFKGGLIILALQTGTVAVRREHHTYAGLRLLRFPKILPGRAFTPEMPVWVWCVETLNGLYLVNIGETTDLFDHDQDRPIPTKLMRQPASAIQVHQRAFS